MGISIHEHSHEFAELGGDLGIKDEDEFGSMNQGVVLVKVEDAVVAQAPAWFRFQNGNEGQIRSDAGGGDAEQLGSSKFLTSAGAGELAELQVNLP